MERLETTSKVEHLSTTFIAMLNEQGYSKENFSYNDLGAVEGQVDLRQIEITATPTGWMIYDRLKATVQKNV